MGIRRKLEFQAQKIIGGNMIKKKALVIIDIQNDITKNYKDIMIN